jgi:hypothetical protein
MPRQPRTVAEIHAQKSRPRELARAIPSPAVRYIRQISSSRS